ncbi:hypothetical protein [Paenimyroides ceti]
MDLLTNDNEEIISHQEMILILRDRIENILKKLSSRNEWRNLFVGRRCMQTVTH